MEGGFVSKETKMLNYKEIVIGSSLEALLFAFKRAIPVFFTEPQIPFKLDFLSPEDDYSLLGLPPCSVSIITNKEPILVGHSKQTLWDTLYFLLSLKGLIPLSSLCTTLRDSNGKLIASNAYSKIAEIEYEHCYYFGDYNIQDLLEVEKDCDDYIVYDWFECRKGGGHSFDLITSEDRFCHSTWFYTSERNRVPKFIKDICVVSDMSRQELFDFDFSETMVKFNTRKIMKEYINPDKLHIDLSFREKKKKTLPTFYPSDKVTVLPECSLPLDSKIEEFEIYLGFV